MLDSCDCAGFWKEQLRYFGFLCGQPVDEEELETVFADKLSKIKPGLYFINNFVRFQYGTLNPKKNTAHRGVVKSIIYHGAERIVAPRLQIVLKDGSPYDGPLQDLVSSLGLGLGKGLGLGLEVGLGTPLGVSSKKNKKKKHDYDIEF
jgi:hypothetical protein